MFYFVAMLVCIAIGLYTGYAGDEYAQSAFNTFAICIMLVAVLDHLEQLGRGK